MCVRWDTVRGPDAWLLLPTPAVTCRGTPRVCRTAWSKPRLASGVEGLATREPPRGAIRHSQACGFHGALDPTPVYCPLLPSSLLPAPAAQLLPRGGGLVGGGGHPRGSGVAHFTQYLALEASGQQQMGLPGVGAGLGACLPQPSAEATALACQCHGPLPSR